MDMQHGHLHAAWTFKCSVDIYMQHGHYMQHQRSWTCCFNGHGYAASKDMDIGMQHGPGHAARTWIYSMDMDMDMDINYYWEEKGVMGMTSVRDGARIKYKLMCVMVYF
jgi:hypothetical protein